MRTWVDQTLTMSVVTIAVTLTNGGAMSFTSPFPDVEIPNLSVYDFLFSTIEEADMDLSLIHI